MKSTQKHHKKVEESGMKTIHLMAVGIAIGFGLGALVGFIADNAFLGLLAAIVFATVVALSLAMPKKKKRKKKAAHH